jgi:hypothetical protein
MTKKYWMRPPLRACVAVLLIACYVPSARAAGPTEVINIDLSPLIDESARYPARFAVDVPHPVSASSQGQWTDNGFSSTWTYTTRIETAVSMSFHASVLALPPSAVLTVAGASSSSSYRSRDVNRGGLWARPLAGDTISLSLAVNDAERSAVRLQIASFQAGYRSLGGTVPDNPHYRQIVAAGAQTSSCTENYSCNATAANQGPAHATVAIVVGNVAQCTGTLLNDTGSDGIAYVLTARHCENGTLGGGDPTAAPSVTVYWDAVMPCGATLASIYDGNAITQSGATTLVEQQDAWLIQLDSPPAANDAYYAGWDASGGTFSGGYSVHHALGYDKQYVGWYGQPILQTIPGATLKIGYASNFLGVVNQQGSVGAGASGGALINPDNNVVGSATLAQLVNGPNTAGVCLALAPAVPSPSTITAQYTALASVWSATADTTSSTGSATLQSVLDAAKTGQLSIGGVGILPVTLTSSSQDVSSVLTGQTITLSWNAPGAQSCTAGGGLSGDGWTGPQASSGTFQLTEQSGANVSYTLHCIASGMAGNATVPVTWLYVAGFAAVTGTGGSIAGTTIQLQWSSNTQPCTASGGSPGDGWAGPKVGTGSQGVVVSIVGSITYTLTCGTGARIGTGQYTINAVAPVAYSIQPDANNMRIGQSVNVNWGGGGLCTTSGGAPGDGWAGNIASTNVGASATITEAVAGTYTYTVTCTGAGLSANTSFSLTFANAPPTVTLTASPTPIEIYTDPGAYNSAIVNLNFTTNIRPCAMSYVGPGNAQGQITYVQGVLPNGSAIDSEGVAGTYVYTVTCGTGANQQQSSATVIWFTNYPAVTLTAQNPWPLGIGSPVAWNSNVYPCTGTGGITGDGWAGSKAGPSGHQNVTESTLGSVTFGITCGSGAQVVQAQAATTVITPTVSISASATTLAINQALLISWTANFAPCMFSVSPGTGSEIVLTLSSQQQTTEEIPGTYTYIVNCAGAQASVPVIFTGPAPTASLSTSASSVAVNTLVTLTFIDPNNSSCTASGGVSGDGWSGPISNEDSKGVTSSVVQTVTYSVLCTEAQGQYQAQTQVTYTAVGATAPSIPTPTVTLTSSAASETVGTQVTLSWNSQNASGCTASAGGSSDGWSGTLALSGTMAVTESSEGTFTYDITCTGAPPAATALATVQFNDVTVTSVAAGKSGGGGGALDAVGLLPLCLLLLRRLRGNTSSSWVALEIPVALSPISDLTIMTILTTSDEVTQWTPTHGQLQRPRPNSVK